MSEPTPPETDSPPPSGKKNALVPSKALSDSSDLRRLDADEKEVHHRALLLYAMQDPERRSCRAAGLAVGKSEGSARNWREIYGWEQRIARHGQSAQAKACQLYRELYLTSFGMTEVEGVSHKMRVPFLVSTPMPDNPEAALHAANAAVRKAIEQAPQSVREKTINFHRQSLDMIQTLVTAFVLNIKENGLSAAGLKASDIPKLLQHHADLAERLGILDPPTTAAGVAALEPSYRVTLATQKNQSIVAAMRADAEEMLLVLQQLEEKQRVEEEVAQKQAAIDAQEAASAEARPQEPAAAEV